MREPIREPTPQEQRPVRAPEPLRYMGPGPVGEAASLFGRGLVEWAPTWGGVFVSLGILFLLSALGVAIGVGSGATGVAIWEAISLIVAFFIGGWFTGRTLNLFDTLMAGAHGLLVWAVSMVFAIVFLVAATVASINSLANLARIAFISNLLQAAGITAGPPAGAASATAVTSSWVTFIILLLAVIAAIGGAIVGNMSRMASVSGVTETTRH